MILSTKHLILGDFTLRETSRSGTSPDEFPMPWFWLNGTGESVVVAVIVQPLVDFATSARWSRSSLTTAIRVQIQSNTTAMIGGTWTSRQVPIVTRSGLITVPEVFLTSNRAETRGDGDRHTGLFRSRCHLVESTCRCGGHGVVGCGGSSRVHAGVGQMLWPDLDHGVDDVVVASDGADSRTDVATTETSTGTRGASTTHTALNVSSTRAVTRDGCSTARRRSDTDSTLTVGRTGCLRESSERSKDKQTNERWQHCSVFDVYVGIPRYLSGIYTSRKRFSSFFLTSSSRGVAREKRKHED